MKFVDVGAVAMAVQIIAGSDAPFSDEIVFAARDTGVIAGWMARFHCWRCGDRFVRQHREVNLGGTDVNIASVERPGWLVDGDKKGHEKKKPGEVENSTGLGLLALLTPKVRSRSQLR